MASTKFRIVVHGFLIAACMALFMISQQAFAAAPAWSTQFPRLFFTQAKVEALQQKLPNDEALQAAWKQILGRADRYLNDELVSLDYAESGSGQHGNYGRPSNQVRGMAAMLGLAYQMTGEEKYAEKLRLALLHFIQLKRWAGDAQRDPPWHSELNTARFCFGYAVGYDSIHDYLSEADRERIRDGMARLGIVPTMNDWVLPAQRIHALDSMGHNWWSVCVGMAGVASLSVLGEHPDAEMWVQEIRDGFPEFFVYQGNVLQNKSVNFDRKGAFYESVNYANYALSEYLLYHLAYTNVFSQPPPEIPLLNSVGDFFIHTAYPANDSLYTVNFGDSSQHASGEKTLQLLKACGFDSPMYSWYLARTDWGLNDPIGLLNQNPIPMNQPPDDLETSMLYPDIGWCMMRDSWQDDASLLAIKSGFAWNHAHPDAGSFILFHGGKPLIIDSGNCSYSRREYSAYYRQSKAHNVVLFDGEAQNPEDVSRGDRGVVEPGRVLHLMDSSGIKYALADATGPTSWKTSRNYRSFLWIDDAILIFDDIRTHDEHQMEWLLHYEGAAEDSGDTVLLSNGDESRAAVHFLYPEDKAFVRKKGLKDHDPDTEVEYIAVTPDQKTREQKFITAVLPYGANGERPDYSFKLLQGDEMLGVQIEHNGKVTNVYLNLRADGRRMHRNSNKVIDGWETDAYLFGFTRAKNADDSLNVIERGFVMSGSYLRKDQQVMLSSLSKVYSVFSYSDQGMDVVLQGQPLVNCSIHSPDRSLPTRLNGETVNPQWNAVGARFQLKQE
ncbi:MAG: heparinase II/III family protein [Candidatus Hinthialibacter antarcticus]|nr:heparinase II/III family protein [Candidatus Hinthialibacter antarcticus]